MNIRTIALLIFLSIITLLSRAVAIDLDPALELKADNVFEAVMSPFCPGRLLKDCPSSAATELRDKIREKIAAGETEEQVFAYLIALYGEQIRSVPRKSGFGLVAWLAPAVFALAGLFAVTLWLKSKRSDDAEGLAQPLDPEMQSRVDAELSRKV